MSIFSGLDLGGLQQVLYPVVEALGGPDIRGAVSGKSEVFHEGADVLRSAADLLDLAAEATSDGILTNDEIEAIVAAAPSVAAAAEALFDSFKAAEEI